VCTNNLLLGISQESQIIELLYNTYIKTSIPALQLNCQSYGLKFFWKAGLKYFDANNKVKIWKTKHWSLTPLLFVSLKILYC